MTTKTTGRQFIWNSVAAEMKSSSFLKLQFRKHLFLILVLMIDNFATLGKTALIL